MGPVVVDWTEMVKDMVQWQAEHINVLSHSIRGEDSLPTETTAKYYFFLFIIWFCEVIGTAATPVLLCQPRVIVKMIVEKQMECRLTGETEVLRGENLPQHHFCPSQNPT
jgi:hypothetical protein